MSSSPAVSSPTSTRSPRWTHEALTGVPARFGDGTAQGVGPDVLDDG